MIEELLVLAIVLLVLMGVEHLLLLLLKVNLLLMLLVMILLLLAQLQLRLSLFQLHGQLTVDAGDNHLFAGRAHSRHGDHPVPNTVPIGDHRLERRRG